MRIAQTIFVTLLIALLTADNAMAGPKSEILVSAESERELQEWAHARHGFVQTQTLVVPAGQLYGILIDYGSGLFNYSVYIYVRQNDRFDLLAYRRCPPTSKMDDNPHMRLDDSGNLLLESNSGRTYLTIPADELDLRWK